MKKSIISLIILFFLMYQGFSQSHDSSLTRFSKKILYGCSFSQAFTSITGDQLPHDYSFKPSVGGGLFVEYYFMKIIGLGIGTQYQQRGAIIINQDLNHELGNPDSTYRERIRFHSFEVPLYIALHSPSISNKVRFFGSLGIIYSKNLKTVDIFHSLEDGFHNIQFPASDYYKQDLLYSINLGIDINAGNTSIFQIQFFKHIGTKNIYSNNSIYQSYQGLNSAYGIRLGFLY